MKILIIDEQHGDYDTEDKIVKEADIVLRIQADGTVVCRKWRDGVTADVKAIYRQARTEPEVSMDKAQEDKKRRLGEKPSAEHDNEAALGKAKRVWTKAADADVDIDWADDESNEEEPSA